MSQSTFVALLLFACRGPATAAVKIAKLKITDAQNNVTHSKGATTNRAARPEAPSQADVDLWLREPLRSEPPRQSQMARRALPQAPGGGGVATHMHGNKNDGDAVLVNDTVMDSLAAEVSQLRPGDIPKFIHTTWISWETLGSEERAFAKKWASLNPTWQHYFWDDSAVKSFLRKQLSTQDFQKLMLMRPVEVCDVFRYAVLERIGGLYCDIDVEPVLPIADWWGKMMSDPSPQLVTGWELRSASLLEAEQLQFVRKDQVQQWLIMSTPHHPILRNVLVLIFDAFNISKPTLDLTGPGPWSDAVLAHVQQGAGLPRIVGHGEGKKNEVRYRGDSPVQLLPKESFNYNGYPTGAGWSDDMLAVHHFKHSWV